MQPLIRIPRHPIGMARFGLPTVLPASVLARLFRTEHGRALFGGVAAHAFQPLSRPLSSAIGVGIITAGHHNGWVVAEGGTPVDPERDGRPPRRPGREDRDRRPHRARQRSCPPADITMFDLTPEAIAGILGDRLPRRVARSLTRFRRSPGAFKVDFAVEGGVPWTNAEARRAGTLHLSGTYAETAATEREIAAGRMPERPFVLVGQQYLADPQRSVGDVHPVYSYAHVPFGYTGDATEAIIAQFERFAPGFRERVVGMAVRSTTEMAVYNPNFVGGDIITGAKDIRQLVFGPTHHRLAVHPRRAGHVPLLGSHAARTGRTRDVWRQRRKDGAGQAALTNGQGRFPTRSSSSAERAGGVVMPPLPVARGRRPCGRRRAPRWQRGRP